MKIPKLTILLSTLAALAAAGPAFAQSPDPQPVTPVPVGVSSGGGGSYGSAVGAPVATKSSVATEMDTLRKKAAGLSDQLTRISGGITIGPDGMPAMGDIPMFGQSLNTQRNAPALIVTRPMDPTNRAQFEQDLKVMDRVLQDEIKRVNGENLRQAMGIKLQFSSVSQGKPVYLEDYGATFSFEASFPLATAAPRQATKQDQDTNESAWDRAKSELDKTSSDNPSPATGYAVAADNYDELLGNSAPGWSATSGRRIRAALTFDSARVDELIDSILKVLPEAKNISQLKDSEFVIVTVAGINDMRAPVRMTLKAKKSDIDRAAAGKLKPDEFKNRVQWIIQ